MKKNNLLFCAIITLNLTIASANSFAADQSFDYPELSAVPRASEQIETETTREKEASHKTHLPYLVPATATFVTGLTLLASGTKSDTDITNTGAKYAPWIGMGVGLAWWAVTNRIISHLDYYSDGSAEINKLPNKTQREQLLRERRAEEYISRAGTTARKIKWISWLTNFGTSIYMTGSAKDKTAGLYIGMISALTSFTPLFFQHQWESAEARHLDYKKRIYAPVIGATILKNPTNSSLSPGLLFALQF